MAVAANEGARLWASYVDDGKCAKSHVEEEVERKRFRQFCAGEAAGTRARVWPNRMEHEHRSLLLIKEHKQHTYG